MRARTVKAGMYVFMHAHTCVRVRAHARAHSAKAVIPLVALLPTREVQGSIPAAVEQGVGLGY